MEKKQQYELMQKIVRELEDLKNSQTSVLKKVAQLEVDNMQINNSTLEGALPEIHEHVDTSLMTVDKLIEAFGQEAETYRSQNEAAINEDPTA